MPRTIPHRELRNNSSEVLREVQRGETIEITNHGEVVAVLVPPTRVPTGGLRLHKARQTGGFAALPRVARERPVQESLDDLRAEQ